jgi:hypothetical protein
MITPGNYNFTLFRGTTDEFRFRLKDNTGATLPYTDIQLTISKAASNVNTDPLVRKKLSENDPGFDIDDYSGVVTWIPTPAESRAVPVGEESAKYEIELRNGTRQLVYLTGTITGIGGINADD